MKVNSKEYIRLHVYIKTLLDKPLRCQRCSRKTYYLDLSNKSGKYLMDLTDWEWICRKCHMIQDGRISKLIYVSRLRRIIRRLLNKKRNFKCKWCKSYNVSKYRIRCKHQQYKCFDCQRTFTLS